MRNCPMLVYNAACTYALYPYSLVLTLSRRAVNVSSQDMRLCKYAVYFSYMTHTYGPALRLWLEHTSKEADLSHLERLLLPTRIPRLGAPGTSLDTEVNQHDKRSVSEKTSTVVEEVVEQEKRRESNQSSS